MFGCLPRIGCLAALGIAALAYVGRDSWYPLVRGRVDRAPSTTAPADTAVWQSLDQARAERGERAVRALAGRSGPVYVNLRAGELASYAFLTLSTSLPAELRDAQAAVIGDRVYVKTVVSPRDLAGALGNLGGFMAERDTLRLGGTFDVLRPGVAQFRVRDVQLGQFPLPAAVIPKVVARVRRGAIPEGVAPDAFPVQVPEYIGDVRVARGRITLYKATP
jgi:hypothetical protein